MSAGRLKPKNDRDFIFIDEPRDFSERKHLFFKELQTWQISPTWFRRGNVPSPARRAERVATDFEPARHAARSARTNHPNPMCSTLFTSCS
jgi:hypothetical protein